MSRLVFIVLVSASLCAGSAIPLVPGDNSHYVEGVSRYFWMPGRNEVPALVDTQEPVDYMFLARKSGADNQYWLFTRNNPTSPQYLIHGDISSVTSSNFVATRPLMVIVHGWRDDGYANLNTDITSAVLDTSDANVIVLDWADVAGHINYFTSAAGVPEVGQYLGNFLIWLINNTGANWNNVHLVGHSLGAHVVGNAGRQAGGLPARVTGLDPARPAFTNVGGGRLTDTDAIYVEAIHTDGKLLGIFNPVANADFYPNGGTNPQPGCLLSTCSHGRSHELFASSVRTNHFVAKQCPSHDNLSSNCSGPSLNMGNNILTKRGSGVYYLKTGKNFPY